jgi:hypothetical protein
VVGRFRGESAAVAGSRSSPLSMLGLRQKFGQRKQTVSNTVAVPAGHDRESPPGRNHSLAGGLSACHFGRRGVWPTGGRSGRLGCSSPRTEQTPQGAPWATVAAVPLLLAFLTSSPLWLTCRLLERLRTYRTPSLRIHRRWFAPVVRGRTVRHSSTQRKQLDQRE